MCILGLSDQLPNWNGVIGKDKLALDVAAATAAAVLRAMPLTSDLQSAHIAAISRAAAASLLFKEGVPTVTDPAGAVAEVLDRMLPGLRSLSPPAGL